MFSLSLFCQHVNQVASTTNASLAVKTTLVCSRLGFPEVVVSIVVGYLEKIDKGVWLVESHFESDEDGFTTWAFATEGDAQQFWELMELGGDNREQEPRFARITDPVERVLAALNRDLEDALSDEWQEPDEEEQKRVSKRITEVQQLLK